MVVPTAKPKFWGPWNRNPLNMHLPCMQTCSAQVSLFKSSCIQSVCLCVQCVISSFLWFQVGAISSMIIPLCLISLTAWKKSGWPDQFWSTWFREVTPGTIILFYKFKVLFIHVARRRIYHFVTRYNYAELSGHLASTNQWSISSRPDIILAYRFESPAV